MAETTLREICHLITDGKHGDSQNEDNSGYYFISAKDVRDWKISYENSREITQLDFEDTHRRTRFEPLDIVVVSTGANIGDVAIAKDEARTYKTTFQKSVAILKPIKEKVNPHYLGYFLSNSRTLLHNISSGSAQKNLLLKDLRNIKIDLPELSVQNKIASTLSAYDDLVENNLQRVKHLEEMISNKFELLFIKPTSIETPILQIADFVKGFEPGTNNYLEVASNDTIPFLRVGDLNKRDSSIFINKELAPHVIAKDEDILLSLDGTVGLVKTGLYGAYSTGVRKVVPKSPLHKAYIYAYLKSQHGQNTINTFARGSTILHAGSAIPKMKIRLPEKKLMEKFAAFGNPSSELIINLMKQNKILQEARDILLPRLLNGTISVKAAEAKIISIAPKKEVAVSQQFKEAVLISMLTDKFGSNEYPLGRKRYTKFSYFFHRKVEDDLKRYSRLAAGMYDPSTKYGGPEKIALENGYIKNHKRDVYTGFISADKIGYAKEKFVNYWSIEQFEWLEQFRKVPTDMMGLYTTVDNAMIELNKVGKAVSVDAIKEILRREKEWKQKLEQPIFSDANIQKAINYLPTLFQFS